MQAIREVEMLTIALIGEASERIKLVRLPEPLRVWSIMSCAFIATTQMKRIALPSQRPQVERAAAGLQHAVAAFTQASKVL